MTTTNYKNWPYLKCDHREAFSDIAHLFDHTKAYVDIRHQFIGKGETPGTGLWHYDSYDGSKEACGRSWLYIVGWSLTEFEDGTKLKYCQWRQYDDLMHRATPATMSGPRILLRVLELDRKPKHFFKKEVIVK